MKQKGLFRRVGYLATLAFTGTVALALVLSLVTRPTGAAPDVVYSNPATITINSAPPPPTIATPYPSTVNVSGMTGTTTKVTVTLSGLSHGLAGDIDVLLVAPSGANTILMSDAGTGVAANNLSITFDQAASNPLDFNGMTSGTFRPTNFTPADTFPAPAPAGPYTSNMTSFDGADPNGDWRLYVVDDATRNSGRIQNGWTLRVTTTGTAATNFTDASTIIINDGRTNASPYPSSINVTGATGVVSNLKVTLSLLSHTNISDVDILLVNPNGLPIILMSDAAFAASSQNVTDLTLVFDDAAPNNISSGSPLTSGTYKPSELFPGGSDAGDIFPPPAPPGPYFTATTLSSFNGVSPNGEWKLFIVDDQGGASGSITSGWSLDITTVPFVPTVLGCGSASFIGPSSFATGSAPTSVAVGNLNADTKPDLVVTNQNSNTVSVLLGDGSGGFGAATNFAVGTYPYAAAIGDVNNDTFPDLAVANSGSNNVSILIGDGMGSFSAATNYGTGPSPISVALGDFNGDNRPDLAVAEFGGFFAGSISVLLNTGTGTFNPAVSFPVRSQPSFVAVGNFTADSNLDLAVANYGSNNVSILLGNGAGSFSTTAPVVNVGTGPVSIAVGDLNNDGKSDLAVANYNNDTVSICRGSGAGTFSVNGIVFVGGNPISVKLAEVSGDGNLDVIVANRSSNNVSASLNNGNGAFVVSNFFDIGAAPSSLGIGDFNSNGQPDLVTSNSSANTVALLVNACAVAKGLRFDFDGDRKSDFSVFRPSNNNWYLLRSTSQVENYIQIPLGVSGDKLVPEDYNGDGITDVAVFRPSTAHWIVPGIYDVQFGLSTDIPVPADFDGDGRADIAIYRPSDGAWYIRKSSDNSWMSFFFGSMEDLPVPRDYDGDGKADAAIFRPSVAGWYIQQSSDNQVRGQQFGISTDRPVPADYDGDGKADIAVFRAADGAWYIYKSSDNGFLSYAWGLSTDTPVQGDFDSDGKFDVAVYRPSDNFYYVQRSTNGSLLGKQWGTTGDIPVLAAYIP
jgi:subtilisin-like proprotein convertase family protein